MYSKVILFSLMLFFTCTTLAWGKEVYCDPFKANICKKGDLIIVYMQEALESCDFSQPTVTVGDRHLIICKYLGYKRQKRQDMRQ